MDRRPYDPARHAAAVLDLWQVSLGDTYPLADRVFHQHTVGNPHYEAGDGVLAVEGDEVIGFALAKLERTARPTPPARGGVAVVLVRPDRQRQGVGRALVDAVADRLRAEGAKGMGVGSPAMCRFWPGVPVDLEGAKAFFEAQGFALQRGPFDLVRDVSDFELPERCRAGIDREGVDIGPATEAGVPEVLAFEQREFSGWEATFRVMVASGDTDHIIVVRDNGKIIGAVATFSPRSRFRAVNVVWETLLGADCGGYGCVGIAASERKRGLGLAMCAVASQVLRERGARNVHVDWTGLVDFYGKLGYKVWREYWMGGKEL